MCGLLLSLLKSDTGDKPRYDSYHRWHAGMLWVYAAAPWMRRSSPVLSPV
jgi:hypothetical protein